MLEEEKKMATLLWWKVAWGVAWEEESHATFLC